MRATDAATRAPQAWQWSMTHHPRFRVLDGWRAIAILLVLAAHLFPLGPKAWDGNVAAGLAGIAIFFSLSGFLVTNLLLERGDIGDFVIRRFLRVVPLAWLYMVIVFCIHPVAYGTAIAHLLFFANYPPKPLIQSTDHLWSLCVEMHFYVGIALLSAWLKNRGLLLLPIFCIAITVLRIFNGMHYSVITHFRVDEILAGATLALIHKDMFVNKAWSLTMKKCLSRLNPWVLLILFAVSCHPQAGAMDYLRPYLAAATVGATMFNNSLTLTSVLKNRNLLYIATISFALYVLHPLIAESWLGSGDTFVRYAKRPLLVAALFLAAHFSTFYYESAFIALGKRICSARDGAQRT